MNIGLLNIGDEVVMGKTVNTNASWLAKECEFNGFTISKHLTVKDRGKTIKSALEYLYTEVDIIITTGGLGPTVDDITKEVCAEFFNEEMVLNEKVLDSIKSYFSSIGQIMLEVNNKQAYFIKNSVIIHNDNGTAPGMISEKDSKVCINLPGPPKELHPMFLNTVLPYLKKKQKNIFFKQGYRLMNIGESQAETLIKSLYDEFPNIKIAPYASVGVLDYIISTNNSNEKINFSKACKKFEEILNDYIIGDLTKTINELIVETLISKNKTIAISESCTGGMLSSLFVDVSGSSLTFIEGLITYSNEAKINRLGVSSETIKNYGAVSKETASEMVKRVALISNADIGLATTGIAGPGGGTKEKPVGLVYTAIYYQGKVTVYKHNFRGDRYKVRLRSVMAVMFNLYNDVIKTF